MSLVKMTQLPRLRRKQEVWDNEEEGGEFKLPEGAIPEGVVDKALSFVPSEGIAVYVALLGFLHPVSHGGRWYLFATGLALAWVYMIAVNVILKAAEKTTGQGSIPKLMLSMMLAGLAFSAWAATLPASPFLELSGYVSGYGAAALLVLGVVLYPVAKYWLKLVPR